MEKTEKKSHIPENILIVLTLLFAVYLTAVNLYRGTVGSVYYAEMGAAVFLIICAVCLRSRPLKRLPAWLAWIIRVIMAAVLVFIAGLIAVVCSGMGEKADKPAEYAAVLGYKLMNGEAAGDMRLRVDEAYSYASAHPETMLIVSGGSGSDTEPSEAEVMRELLISRGISPDRILSEDMSADTKENIENISGMLGTDKSLVIITSGYHIRRALGLAEKAGFSSVQGQSAAQELWLLPANVMWEAVCWFDSFLKGDIGQ